MAAAWPGNSLKRQVLGHHFQSTKAETLGEDSATPVFIDDSDLHFSLRITSLNSLLPLEKIQTSKLPAQLMDPPSSFSRIHSQTFSDSQQTPAVNALFPLALTRPTPPLGSFQTIHSLQNLKTYTPPSACQLISMGSLSTQGITITVLTTSYSLAFFPKNTHCPCIVYKRQALSVCYICTLFYAA